MIKSARSLINAARFRNTKKFPLTQLRLFTQGNSKYDFNRKTSKHFSKTQEPFLSPAGHATSEWEEDLGGFLQRLDFYKWFKQAERGVLLSNVLPFSSWPVQETSGSGSDGASMLHAVWPQRQLEHPDTSTV